METRAILQQLTSFGDEEGKSRVCHLLLLDYSIKKHIGEVGEVGEGIGEVLQITN